MGIKIIKEYPILTNRSVSRPFETENSINQLNCHPNVVTHRRKKDTFVLDLGFCNKTKKPVSRKNIETTNDGIKYITDLIDDFHYSDTFPYILQPR